MKKLIQTQSKNLDNLRVQTIEWTLRILNTQMIQSGTPALNARDYFSGERLISIVSERRSRVLDRTWQIGSSVCEGQEGLIGGDPGWRNHGAELKRLPG